jgi:large subunit ribosomal protein L3
MGKPHAPRAGSMQYWPRKRARRSHARIRNHNPTAKAAGIVGFAGYKTGMTHIIIVDNRPTSMTKGEEISVPVTVVECPELYVYGIRAYRKDFAEGYKAISEVVAKSPKSLSRRGTFAKKASSKELQTEGAEFIRLLVATQPEKTGLDKKTADYFEMEVAGSLEEQIAFAKEHLGKELPVTTGISEMDIVDVHAITKGKGFQGPVKRFGVTFRSHKSEKVIRGPANLGAWTGNRSYRVAHAGQMGYHQRIDLSKQVLAITDADNVQVDGGYVRLGQPKAQVVLIKGSIPGPKKRLVKFTPAMRKSQRAYKEKPEIVHISTRSQQ